MDGAGSSVSRIVVLVVSLLLGGCSTVSSDGASRKHYYFGLVRVDFPESVGDLKAVNVKTLGLGFDGSVFLGWRDSSFVLAKPEDCRTIIILRDKVELAQIKILLENLGEKPCIADFSHSLSPDLPSGAASR